MERDEKDGRGKGVKRIEVEQAKTDACLCLLYSNLIIFQLS